MKAFQFTVGVMIATAAIAPCFANSLVSSGPRSGIAGSKLSARPAGEWNKLSFKEGKNVETWTLDGDALNKVTFYGGIASGKPLLREVDKKRQPLPKVSPNMLLTDIPSLLESTYRSQGSVFQMNIDGQEPALLGKHRAVRFSYTFTRGDEVRRKGEGIGALANGQLFLVTYEAPALHFFDKDLDKFRQLANTLAL